MPQIDLRPLLTEILQTYALPLAGYHGVSHWARVLENGMRLAQETGANIKVVQLFAVLHDSQRLNEGHDPQHGPRAALFAAEVHGRLFELPDSEMALLFKAIHGHTHERDHPNVTVQTCWDADNHRIRDWRRVVERLDQGARKCCHSERKVSFEDKHDNLSRSSQQPNTRPSWCPICLTRKIAGELFSKGV